MKRVLQIPGRFDRLMLVLLVGLAAGLGGVAFLSNQVGLQPPVLATTEVGALGPVGLVFNQKMQSSSVESRLAALPKLEGRTSWDGQKLWFWPSLALQPGTEITLRLGGGSTAEDGQVIRQDTSWKVRVREPLVAFLSPAAEGSEIWIKSPESGAAHKLTQTGNQVFDFASSFDGEWLAYSVKNERLGKDLWAVRRDGSENHKVVDCSGDTCIQPAWSPDNRWIAYSRKRTSVAPGEQFTPQARIWTVELANGKTSALFQEVSIGGVSPSWSPDGRRLAFFDPPGKVIHVLDSQTGKEWMLVSKLGEVGAWSLDSRRLWYGDLVSSESVPYGSAFVADVVQGTIQPLFTAITEPEDIGLPEPTPDGAWVTAGVRFRGGSRSVQLQLMRPDGTERKSITDDHTYTHGAYSWDPSGSKLVFQRVLIGSSQARPEIWIWNRITSSATMVYMNAALPVWLP